MQECRWEGCSERFEDIGKRLREYGSSGYFEAAPYLDGSESLFEEEMRRRRIES
jgi:hypothetical protein